MSPAAARILLSLATDKRVWKAVGTALIAIVVIAVGIGAGCTAHNLQSYVDEQISQDFNEYIAPINRKKEGVKLNAELLYAAYSTLFDNPKYSNRKDVMSRLTKCAYTISKRTEETTDSNGNKSTHTVTVYLAITDNNTIFNNIQKSFDINIDSVQRQYLYDLSLLLIGAQPMTLSDGVSGYQELVAQACGENGIAHYSTLVLAVIQQESGGTGTDPMQCSEIPYNTKFPREPGAITDPAYSIEVGVQYLASCIRAAKVKSPEDISGISLALQGYNFGNGYISCAQQKGGYTKQNASEFSQNMMKKLGWSGYGDIDYVAHVLRYYNASGDSNGSKFTLPIQRGLYTITSNYGKRKDPISGETKSHNGIDFAAPAGTSIYSSDSGTVLYAKFGTAPYGGYGNIVVIQHSNSLNTMYAHCSDLLVQKGQTVSKGQLIAEVGSTGKSTGNHCHYEIRVNNKDVNPMPYLQQ